MEKMKAAVVGTGIFGSFHVRALSELPYVEVAAICDLNKERAERIAAEYGIPRVYSDHKKCLPKAAVIL